MAEPVPRGCAPPCLSPAVPRAGWFARWPSSGFRKAAGLGGAPAPALRTASARCGEASRHPWCGDFRGADPAPDRNGPNRATGPRRKRQPRRSSPSGHRRAKQQSSTVSAIRARGSCLARGCSAVGGPRAESRPECLAMDGPEGTPARERCQAQSHATPPADYSASRPRTARRDITGLHPTMYTA